MIGCEWLDDVDRSLDRNDEDGDGRLDDDASEEDDDDEESEFRPDKEAREYIKGLSLLGQLCSGLVNDVATLGDVVELKLISCDIAVWRIVDESEDRNDGSDSVDDDEDEDVGYEWPCLPEFVEELE